MIHHVQERKVFWDGSSDSDFFLRDVQATTNKHYSRIIRTKVNLAFKQKCESGWFPGNHPPLGYAHQKLRDANVDVAQSAITLCKDAESQYNSHSPSEKLSMLKKLLSHPQLQGGDERKLKYSLKYEVAGLAEARRVSAVSKDWRRVTPEYRTWFILNPNVNVNAFSDLLAA